MYLQTVSSIGFFFGILITKGCNICCHEWKFTQLFSAKVMIRWEIIKKKNTSYVNFY